MNGYHIYEAVGRGKHSTVYKGRKKKTIQYYAIKRVQKSQKQKVLQEVRTLHSLDHPNVLKFYSWYETSAHLWLILEYCVGGDLLTLLRQDSHLPEESIHDFAWDLVQALQFLHSKGVIYCDLKPSNILLDENGRLKFCDFGLARRLSDISKNSVSQLPQAKRGTPCYMAPELFRGGGLHSYASDLWALGCVLYELHSGRPPFVANEFTQLVKTIISDPTPPLHNSASEELSDLVNRLLVKDPAERIQWADVREHEFWKSAIKTLSLPAQPAFSNLVQLSSKVILGASENKQSQAKKGTSGVAEDMPLKEAFAKADVGVDLLRLSKIVKTNIQKEIEGENYRKASSKGRDDDDVKIENHDQELNFAENVEGDQHDESESSEALGSTTPMSEEKASQNGHLTHELQNNKNGISHNASPENGDIEFNSMQPEHQEVAATPPGVGLQRKAQCPIAIAAEMGKRTLPSSAVVDPSTVTMHLSQALWHPSDLSVKAIMFTRKSDKASDHILDPRMLPFEMLSPVDFIKLPPEELDSVINRIVSTLGSSTSINEKQNMLKYIETFCGNVDAANVLINGPIMPLMLKMLRISKSSALRIQLVCVIGLLIRHATIIGDELAGTGIISVLTDALRDKQERIRRFAMAALGELLFYVSTQSDSYTQTGIQESPVKEGRGSSVPWQIPSALIGLISSILRIGEDDATQLYALKTIENIASQGGDWALRFSSNEVICNLCYIFRATGKHESLRLTAGSCLVRLLRFSPSNIQLALEKMSFKDFVNGLSKGNQREQQISINLINMALLGSHTISHMSRHLLSLQEEKTFVPSLVSLLEQAAEVLRGKSFVCAALLCKTSRRWLPLLCNTKVLIAMERLAKEKDVYVQQCIEALVQTVGSIVPSILDSVNSDIRSLCNGKRSGQLGTPQGGRSHARNSLHLFPVVFHLFNSPVIKNRIASTQVLQQLAFFMKHLEAASFQGKEDFQSNLLRIFELVGQEQSILLQNADIYISQVLPSLAILYRTNTDADARFLCLKILFDALVVFLNDISDSPSSSKESRANDLKLISKKHFLTLYPTLILDEDPMPIYAQKLLVMLLDLNCITIADILQLKLLSQFFDFLSDDLSNANLNDIKLCLLLVSSPKVSTQTLSELRVVGRIGTLLKFVTAREMEDFLEPTLCVCKSLLIRSSRQSTLDGNFRLFSEETVKIFDIVHKEASIQDINEFGSYTTIFLELCGYHESNVATCASECLVLALNVTEKASMHVLSNTPNFTKVLELFLRRQNQISSSHIQRRILYTLKVAMKERLAYHTNYYPVSKSETTRLQTVLSGFKNSKDLHVAEAASGVILELESL